MVQAARAGLSFSDYMDMTNSELSAWTRGYEIREVGNKKFFRWAVASLMNLWSKKTLKPTDLMKFHDEMPNPEKDAITLKEMEAIWEKWDKHDKAKNGQL